MSIRLRTLGGFGLEVPGRNAVLVPAGRAHAALLAYLAVERDASVAALRALFWPRRDADHAQHALERHVRELNHLIGERAIEIVGDSVLLTDRVDVDARAFEAAAARGDYEAALAMYDGPFLDGFDTSGKHDFAEWLGAQRERLQLLRDDMLGLRNGAVHAHEPTALRPSSQAEAASPVSSYPLRLFAELKRRRVVRVAAVYSVFAWGAIQVADTVLPRLGIDWAVTLVIVLAALGFPVAVGLAWAFELTPEGTMRPEQPAPGAPRPVMLLPRRFALLTIAGIAVLSVALWATDRLPGIPLGGSVQVDPRLFVVLPFEDSGSPESDIGGRTVQSLFRDAIRAWQDVTPVEDILLNDALQRAGGSAGNVLALGRDVALGLGAGRFLAGTYAERNDSLHIDVGLYAVPGGDRAIATATAVVPADLSDRSAIANALNALLVTYAKAGAEGQASTNVLEALIAMGRADSAQAQWDLQRAAEQYRRAVELDPDYALAWLHLAQVKAWQKHLDAEWRRASGEAARLAAQLVEPDATLARAAGALADERYGDACALFEHAELIAPRNFDARIGLGNCRAWDEIVIADSVLPGQYHFRSSYEAAFRAYRSAIELVPSSNFALAGRLDSLLYVHADQLRRGHLLDNVTVRFLSFPTLDGDTLAFTPHLRAAVNAGAPGTRPAGHALAVERNRGVLQGIFEEWVRAFPKSAQAHASLALVLESLGELRPKGPVAGAFTENGTALSLTSDTTQRLRLTVDRVRLHVKLEEFERARTLADSLLAAFAAPTPEQAELLSGTAALTGRASRTAELLERAAPREKDRLARGVGTVPGPVVEATQRLLAFAALGGPLDSLERSGREAMRRLDAYITSADRDRVRRAVLDRSSALAFFPLGPSWTHHDTVPGYAIVEWQKALASGAYDRVRRVIAAEDVVLESYRPGDLQAERAFNVAMLRFAIGDTVGAAGQLDGYLRNLAMGNPRLLDPVEAATLVRAMRLRTEIATARGEDDIARRWSDAVAVLWRNADPALLRPIDPAALQHDVRR